MNKPQKTLLLDKNSVVLITGGAKGITARCAIRLAEEAGCNFILAGRSALLPAEPDWAEGANSPDELQKKAIAHFKAKDEKVSPKELQKLVGQVVSAREINATLNAIQSSGGQAIYIAADVTDENSFSEQVKQAEAQLGQISGVIHGAGNLADKKIENKTAGDFDLVVNTKVRGLSSVLKCVDLHKLKFLVLFSSVAGFFGNAGQTDYALANEVLNKSAHILRKSLPDCRVIAFNWGPWDSGMVSPQLKKYFESRGIPLINTDEGADTLVKAISGEGSPGAQVVVGSPIFGEHEVNVNNGRPVTIHRRITLEDNPFAQGHKIGPNPVLPATCASGWLVSACEASYPGWHFSRMEDFKVLKGVIFDGQIQEYQMTLEKHGDNAGDQVVEAVVTSRNEKGRHIFHYSGTVILSRELPSVPVHPSQGFASLPTLEGGNFYKDGTLFHGPLFRGIQEVAFDQREKVITRISLPLMDDRTQGQFPVGATNPFINDAIVQSLLIWSQENYAAPCLPSRLKEWVQYRPIPFGVTVWAELTVTYHSEHAVAGDILVTGEDGREYFHYIGLEGTISQQLNRYIGRNAKTLREG
jgi:NAD(P)-dependent dehydrogenase (short-subunit alcohol dehydrogenase family)